MKCLDIIYVSVHSTNLVAKIGTRINMIDVQNFKGRESISDIEPLNIEYFGNAKRY